MRNTIEKGDDRQRLFGAPPSYGNKDATLCFPIRKHRFDVDKITTHENSKICDNLREELQLAGLHQ